MRCDVARTGLTACRFVVRDFKFDETAVVKQRKEQEELERQEKDQWVSGRLIAYLTPQADLLRLSRINFSEAVQLLIHLKVVRAFVECVLRYGLPAHYFLAFVKVRSAVRRVRAALVSSM